MQRTTLLLFLAILAAILAFAAGSGAVSLFWSADTAGAAATSPVHGDFDEDTAFANGVLSGRITDARTGEPIEGVEVGIQSIRVVTDEPARLRHVDGPESAKSDEDGVYRITVPASQGQVRISFQLDGYRRYRDWFGFDGDREFDVVLGRNPRVSGTIVTTATPEQQKKLYVLATKKGLFGAPTSRSSTSPRAGSDGVLRYELSLEENSRWTVLARTSDRRWKTTAHAIEVGSSDQTLDLDLLPADSAELRSSTEEEEDR